MPWRQVRSVFTGVGVITFIIPWGFKTALLPAKKYTSRTGSSTSPQEVVK